MLPCESARHPVLGHRTKRELPTDLSLPLFAMAWSHAVVSPLPGTDQRQLRASSPDGRSSGLPSQQWCPSPRPEMTQPDHWPLPGAIGGWLYAS